MLPPVPHGARATTVQFKKLNAHAVIPKRAHPSDAGFDLSTLTEVLINPGQHVMIPTGIACSLPENTYGLIAVRSSLGVNLHTTLSNSVGIIDNSYRGE